MCYFFGILYVLNMFIDIQTSSLDQPASINSRFSSVDDHTRSLTTAGVRRSDWVYQTSKELMQMDTHKRITCEIFTPYGGKKIT